MEDHWDKVNNQTIQKKSEIQKKKDGKQLSHEEVMKYYLETKFDSESK